MTNQPRIAIPVPTIADFEYNLRSSPNYMDAIREAGGEPVEISLTLTAAELARAAAACHGIILPGSPADVDPQRYGQEPVSACAPADPAREAVDLFLLEDAYRTRKPILGICFGTQIMNVWRGGTLLQDLSVLPVNHSAGRSVASAHTVAVAPASVFGEMLRPPGAPTTREVPERDGLLRLPVNSSHHQAVGVPGEGLHVAARCPQDAVIEAVEGAEPDHFVLGVQWHPERSYLDSPASRSLFARLVHEAAAWQSRYPVPVSSGHGYAAE